MIIGRDKYEKQVLTFFMIRRKIGFNHMVYKAHKCGRI